MTVVVKILVAGLYTKPPSVFTDWAPVEPVENNTRRLVFVASSVNNTLSTPPVVAMAPTTSRADPGLVFPMPTLPCTIKPSVGDFVV